MSRAPASRPPATADRGTAPWPGFLTALERDRIPGAYFSLVPFFGAAVSLVVLREPIGAALISAGALMAVDVWLHLTERHNHDHHHERIAHSRRHVHDEHHQHSRQAGGANVEPHTHEHVHEPMIHIHQQYPDLHHRHRQR